MNTAIAFTAGLVLGTGFGFIVCAVISHDTRTGGMYEDMHSFETDDM